MGKPHNRKLQKQYQKEQTAAKKLKGTSSTHTPEEPGLLYQVFKVLLLMALPLLFLIFGLIMFPINLGDSGNDTQSETSATQRSAEGYCVGDDCPQEKDRPVKTTKNGERTPITLQQNTKSGGDSDSDNELPPEIRDFQATILDHLTIQDIVVDGRTVKAVELTSEEGRKGAATR